MGFTRWMVIAISLGVCAVIPSEAHAQYKNWNYGFDVGYMWNLQYSVFDESQGLFVAPQNRPIRLSMGGRVGGETGLKLAADNWWINFRLNLGFWSFVPTVVGNATERAYDIEANRTLGTLLALQGAIGVRYLFMTDRVRPYLQMGLSFMHLFSFIDTQGYQCDTSVCGSPGYSNLNAYLAHQNAGGIHVQPGLEWVFTRDIALHVFLDVQTWLVLNAPPHFGLVGGIGLLFFS